MYRNIIACHIAASVVSHLFYFTALIKIYKVNSKLVCLILISGSQEQNDYVESVVCKREDINENEMKLLPLGDNEGKILLIKQKGKLHAIGTKCTHYGALLHTGALGEGRVRCPWHGACFNIKTGDIEDYPGLDSLPCYKVLDILIDLLIFQNYFIFLHIYLFLCIL